MAALHGTFSDVKLTLFTQRLPAGRIGKPGVVYANSAILSTASPYFHGLLRGGFAESNSTVDGLGAVADESTSTATYGYDSDSDLEDTDDEFQDEVPSLADPQDFPEASGSSESTANATTSNRECNLDEGDVTPSKRFQDRPWREIVVKDSALITWRWVILYLYTGQIVFAPLRSQGIQHRKTEIAQYLSSMPSNPTPCSPKSMYRLADILGFDRLKQLALDRLIASLTVGNVCDELFSEFSSRHADVFNAQIQFFRRNCMRPEVLPSLQTKFETLAAGGLPHGALPLLSLFQTCLLSLESVRPVHGSEPGLESTFKDWGLPMKKGKKKSRTENI
ncbi:predicted protein [Postia placenta Mad-698-R]|nr:predicted protein [Postia placenta Mad-698-R]